MKLFASVCLSLALGLVIAVGNAHDASAQSLRYFAVGDGAQYNPVTYEYSGAGIGIPFGLQVIEGTAIPSPEDPDSASVFFQGTFSGEQVTHTFLGDIHSTLSGDVKLEFDENGMAFGTWNPSFVVNGGTGIFKHAKGRLEGVAINPPFDPTMETWPFSWQIEGRINLRLWRLFRR